MDAAKALHALVPPVALATGSGLVVALMIALSAPAGLPGEVQAGGVRVKAKHGLLVANVAGHDGQYPGTSQRKWVRLTNPNDFEIQVNGVTALAATPVDQHDQPVAGCLTTVAQVKPLGAPLRVPANGSRDVALTVRLATTVQRACKKLRFPLTYSGTAFKP